MVLRGTSEKRASKVMLFAANLLDVDLYRRDTIERKIIRDKMSNWWLLQRIEQCQVDLRSKATLHWLVPLARSYVETLLYGKLPIEVEIDFRPLDSSSWIHLAHLKRIVRAFEQNQESA